MNMPFRPKTSHFVLLMPSIFVFVGWFFILPGDAEAQPIDVETLIERQGITCQEIAYSTTQLLPIYHRDNQPDTIYAMLAFWQDNCGGPEPMVRFRILYQIETNTFSDDWYPDNILNLLDDYRGMVTTNQNQPYYYDYFLTEYVPVHPDFSAFTTNLASHLKRYRDLRPVESFFLDFYAQNFDAAMKSLDAGDLNGTRIDSLYRDKLERLKKAKHPYFGLYAGSWRPNGKLSVLGNHMQVGFLSGSVKNHVVTNFNFMIGFLNPKEEYYVVVDNVLYDTQSYLSIHAGFDIGFEMIRTQSAALVPTVGLGVEGFEAFSMNDQETYGLSKFIGSLNFNAGLEYRIILEDTGFLGLQAKYHFINYKNKGGTDLSGNTATFGLVLGFGR